MQTNMGELSTHLCVCGAPPRPRPLPTSLRYELDALPVASRVTREGPPPPPPSPCALRPPPPCALRPIDPFCTDICKRSSAEFGRDVSRYQPTHTRFLGARRSQLDHFLGWKAVGVASAAVRCCITP